MFPDQTAGLDTADERVDEGQVGPLGGVVAADDTGSVALRQQSRTQARSKAFDAIDPLWMIGVRVFERVRQNRLGHLVHQCVLAVDQPVDRRKVGPQPVSQPSHRQRFQSALVDQRQSFADHTVHGQVRQRHAITSCRGG